MSDFLDTDKEASLVIREIESQLETLLARKKDEIEVELAARIRAEEDAAKAKKESLERDIDRERETLRDFRTGIAEAEEERQRLLEGIRAGFSATLDLQSQIEALVKRTVEEISRIADLQRKLESVRQRTAERAAFLKNDLKERFGIAADARPEPEAGPGAAPDLDAELEKLRRIRTLLSGAAEGRPGLDEIPGKEREEAWQEPIPEIQELIQAATLPHDGIAETPVSRPAEDPAAALERLRRIEPVEGSGEISFFREGSRSVLDAGRLLEAVDRAVDVAWKLTGKLEGTDSPRDRFFIKQELVNGQESLRNLLLRAASLVEARALELPSETLDIIDVPGLRSLADRLSTGNWANSGDLAVFAGDAKKLRAAFLERTTPPDRYLRSILEALGGPGSVERAGLP